MFAPDDECTCGDIGSLAPSCPVHAEALAATLELARRIVEAVRDDEEGPLERKPGEDMFEWRRRIRLAAFQIAHALTIAESKLAELESDDNTAAQRYEATIDDNLPHYSIGTDVHGEDDLANYHERVEYAGEELRELRRYVMRMHDEREEVRQLVIAYVNATHTNDANCAAGDHDDCTQPAALRRLLVAVEAHVKGGERCE